MVWVATNANETMTNDDHRLDDAEPSDQPSDAPRDDNGDAVLPDDSTDHDTNHNLNESADKIRVNLSLKRGTDTRDQDSYDIKARGETPEEAAEAFAVTVAELEQRDTFERVRNVQPSVEADDE